MNKNVVHKATAPFTFGGLALLYGAPRNATVSSTGVERDAVCGTARRSNASRSLSCMFTATGR